LRAAIVQAKLTVGPATDVYEAEADDVARRVVRALRVGDEDSAVSVGGRDTVHHAGSRDDADAAAERPAKRVQRSARALAGHRSYGGGGTAGRIQRAAAIGVGGGELDADTMRRLEASRSGGQPLPDDSRSRMEGAFGADFSDVRVHVGAAATDLSERIQATAFTAGSDIYFRDGLPDSSTSAGQALLAHELTHAIQQGAARQVTRSAETVRRQPALGAGATRVVRTNGASGGKIQRLFGGFYVVCAPDAAGAVEVSNDTVVPKRHYRKVQELPPNATKAENQPWYMATLYVTPRDAEVHAPTAVPEPASSPPDAVVVEEPQPAPSTDNTTGTNRKKKRGKKKTKTTPVEKPVAAAESAAPDEPAWTTKYRETTAANGWEPSLTERNIPYLRDQELAPLSARLDAALERIETAWIPELEAAKGGAPRDERIAELRDAYPTWDGDVRLVTRALAAMKAHVESVEREATDIEKVTTLRATLPAQGMADMLEHFTVREMVVYAEAVGVERLRFLLAEKHVGADALKHYGATMMKTFIGADEITWNHLVTAGVNAKGAISGAHDEAVFLAYLPRIGYQLDPSSSPPGDQYTVTYTDASGTTKGRKTLIRGLAGDKETWMASMNRAIWACVRAKMFATGEFVAADGSQRYNGFYKNGEDGVDTVYPT
jgi:hypothetical protein